MIHRYNAIVYLFCVLVAFYILFYSIHIREKSLIVKIYSDSLLTLKKLIAFGNTGNPAGIWNCINQTVCVYSAFWDERFDTPLVHIVAIISKDANITAWRCLTQYNDDNFSSDIPLKMKALPEGHRKNHMAVFLSCATNKKPVRIGVIAGQQNTPFIIVQDTKPNNEAKGQLAVCVRPVFGEFLKNNSIVAEFIAYYKILGADQFMFYDYKANLSLKQLFHELILKGLPLIVLPWNLPEEMNDAWAFGQMGFIADCVYRNSQKYEFVAVLDVDEFIVPKNDVSLKDVIKGLSKSGSKWGTYIFRQTFFCMEYQDDPSSINLTIPLVTQTKTRHENKIWPYYDRSKYIVRPTAVILPGIHYTWNHAKYWRALHVDRSVALLHHYRAQKCKINNGEEGIIEPTALRYGKIILNSTALEVWKNLNL